MKTFELKENTEKELCGIISEIKSSIRDSKYPNQKYLVKFKKEVSIVHNSKKRKEHNSILLSFFVNGDRAYYSVRLNPARGYYVTSNILENMESITIYEKNELNPSDKVGKFVSKFHHNLWDNIKEELLDDYTQMETKYYSNYSLVNISQKFPKHVLEALKVAIENKQDYNYKSYGTKRDLSVTTKLCEDGVYRGWFSSEFQGCGNGSYYILINPTTAALREDD